MFGRIVVLFFSWKSDELTPVAWTIVYSSYLVLTELIPFAYLVFSMFQRFKVYKKASS